MPRKRTSVQPCPVALKGPPAGAPQSWRKKNCAPHRLVSSQAGSFMFLRTFLTSFSRSLRALCSSSRDFFIFLLSCRRSRHRGLSAHRGGPVSPARSQAEPAPFSDAPTSTTLQRGSAALTPGRGVSASHTKARRTVTRGTASIFPHLRRPDNLPRETQSSSHKGVSEGAEPALTHTGPTTPRRANTYPLLTVPSNS